MHSTGINRAIRRHDRPIVLVNLSDPLPLVQGLVAQANELGWRLLDIEVLGYIPRDLKPVGAIVACLPRNPLLAQLKELGCPTVSTIGYPDFRDNVCPTVLCDKYAHGRLAAAHLAERGFKDIAFIGNKPLDSGAWTYRGFKEVAGDYGINLHLLEIDRMDKGKTSKPQRSEHRMKTAADWLASLPKPVGVLGYHISMASKLCSTCYSNGLAMPEEVGIISYGDNPAISELAPVPLSATDKNQELQGREAVNLLHRMVEGEHPPEEPILIPPAGVVQRQSTDVLAVADERVAKAMRYAWNNLDQPLSVEDIAREVDVPRSTLDRLFNKHLGRSINAELRRKRLELCCSLLRQTDCSFAEITHMVGFQSVSYLRNLMVEETGMTPTAYRRKHGA